ncbi:unnamed protein product, partial [Laminaria digitata]
MTTGIKPANLQKMEMKYPPSIVFDPPAIALAVSLLRESKSQVEGKQVLGVDAEWETAISGRQKVATIQIAPLHGTPFLFHLQWGPSGFTKETFPALLKDLLADPSIIKTGVAIKTDATHIFSDYGVEVVNTVDLRSLAKSNLVHSNLVSVTRRHYGVPAGEASAEGRRPVLPLGELSSQRRTTGL